MSCFIGSDRCVRAHRGFKIKRSSDKNFKVLFPDSDSAFQEQEHRQCTRTGNGIVVFRGALALPVAWNEIILSDSVLPS